MMPYITVAAAARLCKTCPAVIRTGIYKGEIKCRSYDAHVTVDVDSVLKYNEGRLLKRLAKFKKEAKCSS